MSKRAMIFSGLSILIVEDEVMIAMMLEDALQDLGCRVTLASTVADAMALVSERLLDGALLDMNVHGQKTTPIAEELTRKGVPFLLVTGYAEGEHDPPVIRHAPRLQKPFSAEELARRMGAIFVPPAATLSLH